jgi:hypothetical protein
MVYFFQRLLSPGFHLNARYSVPKTRNHHPRISTQNNYNWQRRLLEIEKSRVIAIISVVVSYVSLLENSGN